MPRVSMFDFTRLQVNPRKLSAICAIIPFGVFVIYCLVLLSDPTMKAAAVGALATMFGIMGAVGAAFIAAEPAFGQLKVMREQFADASRRASETELRNWHVDQFETVDITLLLPEDFPGEAAGSVFRLADIERIHAYVTEAQRACRRNIALNQGSSELQNARLSFHGALTNMLSQLRAAMQSGNEIFEQNDPLFTAAEQVVLTADNINEHYGTEISERRNEMALLYGAENPAS